MSDQNPCVLSEQPGRQYVFETKADVAKAMGEIIGLTQTREKIQHEFDAVYKAAMQGSTKQMRKEAMDAAIIDLASRAVLSDLMLTMLTNGLPEGTVGGGQTLIQVKS